MLIALLAYLGGMLTIVSPCILPVLPFVFANAGRSFTRGALPMLAGMALTFAIVATLAAIGGSWAVRANEIGRWVALLLLALFGLALIFPALSDRATRPLVALGSRLSERQGQDSIWSSVVLGIATGLLWAPCAGPILGIIFTAAALQGATLGTSLLLLAYALGAATSLALALLVGGKVFQRMKGSLHATEQVRRVLGVLVIAGVVAIALGLDTRVLSKVSSAQTASLEHGIAQKLGLGGTDQVTKIGPGGKLPVEGEMPSLDGLGPWINSGPLTREQLRGKVVVIDFWTYSCINCIRSIPYVRAWYETYKDDGLVVIGIHAPEFAFERSPENVRKAVADLGIKYPVALDNKLVVWSALKNRYWPAHYFFDAQGRQRYHHFGEGRYGESEMVIRQLLAEAGRAPKAGGMAKANAQGAEAAAALASIGSPETYIGYRRADRFVSPGGQAHDAAKTYGPAALKLNDWSLEGNWTVGRQSATLNAAPGAIAYRFHARDLHLVLGSAKPVRFRITIDGKAPGPDSGVDVKPDGSGVIQEQRLYQLVRQQGDIRDRTFRIEFIDPGVEAFAFTFG
ncbi:cytochrome c biogenesis protein DipZ [Sphingomonas daechungensis]|uniref:Cytochrome c biogenesis protein DipZ n=1 Tax=Sphingomonas daechungensis TaxID=1176646 RepID=A0ABX6T9E0_9SPHN|nr:cytochrome c biogenesis protein DipZ [Sphingomonas daechungensis]QNP44283.1 cytochrome c biogenesis protein DipZ [Sphingomonas daechungensis]